MAKKAVAKLPDFGDEDSSGDFEVEQSLPVVSTEVKNTKPDLEMDAVSQDDPNWTDYVLSFLSDTEKYNKNPKMHGLRRLVHLLLGPIVEADTTFFETSHSENGNRCSAKHTIRVHFKSDGSQRIFVGCADSSPYNTDKMFVKFPVAMAETRAKSRAYINALSLACNSSDEMVDKPAIEQTWSDDSYSDRISQTQLDTIDLLCKRKNLNARAIFKFYQTQYGFTRISDAEKRVALEIIKNLNSSQGFLDKIDPKELTGYLSCQPSAGGNS